MYRPTYVEVECQKIDIVELYIYVYLQNKYLKRVRKFLQHSVMLCNIVYSIPMSVTRLENRIWNILKLSSTMIDQSENKIMYKAALFQRRETET